MPSYLLALEIDPMDVNRDYAMLPLHCTLMYWFLLNMEPADLTKLLGSALRLERPQELRIGGEATFAGHTKQGSVPVKVNKIIRTSSLRQLHLKMYDLLESLGAKNFGPQYVGDGYAPHVTQQAGAKLSANETRLAKVVYLVTANAPEYGNHRHVVAKFQLED